MFFADFPCEMYWASLLAEMDHIGGGSFALRFKTRMSYRAVDARLTLWFQIAIQHCRITNCKWRSLILLFRLHRHLRAVPNLNPVTFILILMLNLVVQCVVLFEVGMALGEMLLVSLLLKIFSLSWGCHLIVILISKLRGFEFCVLIVGLYAFSH